MSTVIRPELSEKNPYHMEKHRYYELKHFCLQYLKWKQLYLSCSNMHPFGDIRNGPMFSRPTERIVMDRDFYLDRMIMVESACREASSELSEYILAGVTQGLSYDILKARLEIPCGKDLYYELYRKFFAILDEKRK